jgi:hypothetical protein
MATWGHVRPEAVRARGHPTAGKLRKRTEIGYAS